MKKSLLTVMAACGICTGVFGAGRDLSVNSEKTGERPAAWKPVTWANVPGAATLKIIETPDHIDGGKAVYWKVNETSPEKAPEEGEYVTMTFEKGVPTSVNGKEMKVSDIIRELNRLGGKHGVGIIDIVEKRVVGMKSRGVYEKPRGTILM